MTNATNINHVKVIKTLRDNEGFRLLAIKKGEDIGFAIANGDDVAVKMDGERFMVTNIDSHVLWTVDMFREIKARHETTELFFDEVTKILGKN